MRPSSISTAPRRKFSSSNPAHRLRPSSSPRRPLSRSRRATSARCSRSDSTADLGRTQSASPNIYLGATSAFGLQIVVPDADGDGARACEKGDPNANGWRASSASTRAAGPARSSKSTARPAPCRSSRRFPAIAAPDLGDIVFDPATRQFFVSDLDTGLIHRLDSAGNLIDAFDHGQTGRPRRGLPAVADDGAKADIKSPAFDALRTRRRWGFTQPERRVWGLGLRAGRLYYAVADGPTIWSVSINLDGTFGADPRREIEVSGTPNNHPISDIAFDNADYMYVAQRGGIKGSYDYSVFADAKQSVVFRFKRRNPRRSGDARHLGSDPRRIRHRLPARLSQYLGRSRPRLRL